MNIVHPKSFACKSSGCNLNFANEDHLNVHEKKHEMMLTIEHKVSNVFLVDQTPTPTKLIKNCEEVGLFEDLRNVNPFDETFRRAVETKTNLSVTHQSIESKILCINEDTLHTPQVFPNPNDESNNCQNFPTDKEKIFLSTNIDKKKKKTHTNDVQKNYSELTKRQKSTCKITKQLKSPKLLTEHILLPVSNKSHPIIQNAINLVQPKNITWQSTKKLILPKPATIIESTNSPENHINSVKEKLKAVLTKNDMKQRSTNDNKNEKAIKQKKRSSECLERRKAAAARYRKKKHIEQCDLQKQNAELLLENLELKTKLKQLQELLLEHQNCNLTKTTINNSPNGITAQILMRNVPFIQIPASRIVMEIPKLLIRPGDIKL